MKFLNFLFKFKTMRAVGVIGAIVILIVFASQSKIGNDFKELNPFKDVNFSEYIQTFKDLNVSGFSIGQKNTTLNAKVVKVIDGDTIEVLDSENNTHRIRLFGIDAPEKKQSFGNKAKGFLASLISGKEVQILIKGKDKFKRDLGIIMSEGKDINKEMVKNGYAWAYARFSKDYILDQADAHAFKLGLWSEENPQSPAEFRKQKKNDVKEVQ